MNIENSNPLSINYHFVESESNIPSEITTIADQNSAFILPLYFPVQRYGLLEVARMIEVRVPTIEL